MKHRASAAAVLLAALCVTANLAADIVTDWNTAALNSIRADRTPPPVASRNLAMLHAAIYDAANGVSQDADYYWVKPLGKGEADATSAEAAATSAARRILCALYPANAAAYDALNDFLISGIPAGPARNKGIVWGEQVATSILMWRATDGANAVVPTPAGSGPGVWSPTPPAFAPYLLPQWAFVRPFSMKSCSQFRPPPPPELDSAQWTADYIITKELGATTSAARTPDQTQIALFWADGAGTETPPGHWNDIAQDLAAARGHTLQENARLFALLNLAMADAAICAWDAKLVYDWWRPVSAIRAGDADGNPFTVGDVAWTPLIVTPPFPEHTSGHSTFSSAAATVLARFYGSDRIAFSTGSDALPGVIRSFTSFSAAASEAGMSRVFGGIHFLSANVDGLHAGRQIGDQACSLYLRDHGSKHSKSAESKPAKVAHPKPGHIPAQPPE